MNISAEPKTKQRKKKEAKAKKEKKADSEELSDQEKDSEEAKPQITKKEAKKKISRRTRAKPKKSEEPSEPVPNVSKAQLTTEKSEEGVDESGTEKMEEDEPPKKVPSKKKVKMNKDDKPEFNDEKDLPDTPKVRKEEQEKDIEIFSEASQADSNEEGIASENENINPTIRKSIASQTEEASKEKPKKKKASKKKEPVFKLNKINPAIVPIDKTPVLEEKGPFVEYNDLEGNNRNVHRAVFTNDTSLFKKCIANKKRICSIHDTWGPDYMITPFEIAISLDRQEVLTALFSIEGQAAQQRRVVRKNFLLKYVGSGQVSNFAFGRRVRKVQMTRGNKQGNNAFLEKQICFDSIHDNKVLSRIMRNQKTEFATLEKLFLISTEMLNSLSLLIFKAVRKGNRILAGKMINHIKGLTNYGFSDLHVNVLLYDTDDLPEFHKATAHKKAVDNMAIAPLHCACINPNEKYLDELLKSCNEIQLQDNGMAKLIHYAAVCDGSGPLKLLLKLGANANDLDNKKRNPLFYAAKAGRAENCRILLEASPMLIKAKNKKNHHPIQYAAKYGHIEVIKVLKEFKSRFTQKTGYWGMAPLHLAAAQNHFELVKWIIENKGKVNVKDKYGRTPLILAARNGLSKVVNLLLQKGSHWNEGDKSENTPLHFAAAYGWEDALEELIKAGANPNALNAWKITPLNIAMLMGRMKIVKRLLNIEGIDVNVKDDNGRTLISLAMEQYNPDEVDDLEFLLKEKKANPNIQDLQGMTAMHWLIQVNYEMDLYDDEGKPILEELKKKQMREMKDYKKKVLSILLKYGADPSICTKDKRSVISMCLASREYELMEFFIDVVSFNKSPELFNNFSSIIYNPIVKQIFMRIYKKDPVKADTLNTYLNAEGYPIYLLFINDYIKNYSGNYNFIRNYISDVYRTLKYSGNPSPKENEIETTFEKIENHIMNNAYAMGQILSFDDNNVINRYTDHAFDRIYTKILIEVLKMIIDSGANTEILVGKLEMYRISKEERKLQKQKAKIINQQLRKPYNEDDDDSEQEEPIEEENQAEEEEEDEEKSEVEDINKKFVVEYGKHGLSNSYHIAMENPNPMLLDFLDSLPTSIDVKNYYGYTPFRVLIDLGPHFFNLAFSRLISNGVIVDSRDKKEVTPFLSASSRLNENVMMRLLNEGADINATDVEKNFALRYAVAGGNINITNELLKKGANIEQKDLIGRTVLHVAINDANPNADTQSDMENLLLQFNADINAKDNRGRTPLHYCFVKIGHPFECSFIDPIETVANLCSFIKIKIDEADNWGKTPLHYSAQRGAIICGVFLLGRGSKLEAEDRRHNTPLAISFMNGHPNYAIMMIEKGADVMKMVHPEPYTIEDSEKEDIQRANPVAMQADPNTMVSMADPVNCFSTAGRGKGRRRAKRVNPYEKKTAPSSIAIPFGQNNVNQFGFGGGLFGGGFGANNFNGGGNSQPKADGNFPPSRTIKEERSMFRIAIIMGWQGLIYLLIDRKYDYMLGMEDALNEQKYKLVLNLLKKTPDDKTVQKFNKHNQNLIHILAQFGAQAAQDQLNAIYDIFIKRGVEQKVLDDKKRTALEYAVESNNFSMLVRLMDSHYDPNNIDINGDSALTLAIKGNNISSCGYNIGQLFRSQVNTNIKYREKYYAEKKSETFSKEEKKAIMESDTYVTTPIIHAIRYSLTGENYLKSVAEQIIQRGANPSICDSEGRNALFYAVIHNNYELSCKLMTFCKESKSTADIYNKTIMHYAVQVNDMGTFENHDMLKLLLDNNFAADIPDSKGNTAADLASRLYSQKLANIMRNYHINCGDNHGFYVTQKVIEVSYNIPFAEHAEAYVKKNEEKLKLEIKKLNPDRIGGFESSYEVVYDEELGPYDIYMTKVNLKNGIYGEYLFYRMQLLRETNRDVYVVFTRWGRIGEPGAFQRNPFDTLEKAKVDYNKIFKAKSANEWANKNSFVKTKGKYVIMKTKENAIGFKDLLVPFYYKSLKVKTSLPKPLCKLMKSVANVTVYSSALSGYGINTELLPLSKLEKNIIRESKSVLDSLKEVIGKYDLEKINGMKADATKLQEYVDEIYDKSSRFYELIPMEQYKEALPAPIQDFNTLNQKYAMLDELLNVEMASKILLAAKYNEDKVNPLEYIYKCLDCSFDRVNPETDEYKVLLNYIINTKQGNVIKIKNIFKIVKKGEQEKFIKATALKNRMMLFHGTKTYNYLGILGSGLKIAPPGAQITGWAFGKGLYFADMAGKSMGYCQSYAPMMYNNYRSQKQNKDKYNDLLMLINEVSLGRQYVVNSNVGFDGKLPEGYDSLKACGNTGPDFKNSLMLKNGAELPQEKVVQYKVHGTYLAHNEYVVFDESRAKMQYLIQFTRNDVDEY